MDVVFVKPWNNYVPGQVAILKTDQARSLLELGVVKPLRRERRKAVVNAPERAVHQ